MNAKHLLWKDFMHTESNFCQNMREAIDRAIDGASAVRDAVCRATDYPDNFKKASELVVSSNILATKLIEQFTLLLSQDQDTARVLLRSALNQLKLQAPNLYKEIREIISEQDRLS